MEIVALLLEAGASVEAHNLVCFYFSFFLSFSFSFFFHFDCDFALNVDDCDV